MSSFKFSGLCTATHTPFYADGSLNLAVVEKQAAFLRGHGITSVFIGGTTGESRRSNPPICAAMFGRTTLSVA